MIHFTLASDFVNLLIRYCKCGHIVRSWYLRYDHNSLFGIKSILCVFCLDDFNDINHSNNGSEEKLLK